MKKSLKQNLCLQVLQNDKCGGFAEHYVLYMTVIMLIVLSGLCVRLHTSWVLINSYVRMYSEKEEAKKILFDIEKDFDCFVDEEIDCENSYALVRLQQKYSEYNLCINDCSSGINKNFVPEEFIYDGRIQACIHRAESSGAFVNTDFGWKNKNFGCPVVYTDEVIEEKNFVNRIPLVNINFCDESLMKAAFEFFRIQQADKKTSEIINLRRKSGISREKLKEIIVPGDLEPWSADNTESSKDEGFDKRFMDFFGSKTTFWKIEYRYKRFLVSAVIAGFADDADDSKIGKYKIIERKIKSGGVYAEKIN